MIIIQVAGRVGKDPESRFTPSGQKLTTFSLATNIKKGGAETTVWWRITVWGDRFEKMMPYIKKGSALIITGELSRAPEIYTDKEGKAAVSSLDLTAEIIKFSPFGSPDGANKDKGAAYGSTPAAGQAQHSVAEENSFGDFSGGGMAGFGSVNGLGQESNSDERMPF